MNTRLIAKIAAYNKLHREFNRLYPLFQEALKPFVRRKVILVHREITSQVKAILPEVTAGFSIYQNLSDYTLYFTLQCAEDVQCGGCVYAEATMSLGTLTDGILLNLCEIKQRRSDYHAEEIFNKRIELEKASERVREIESELSPFGTHNN